MEIEQKVKQKSTNKKNQEKNQAVCRQETETRLKDTLTISFSFKRFARALSISKQLDEDRIYKILIVGASFICLV